MGRWHAYYAERCGARIEGVVDIDSQAAKTLCERVGSKPPDFRSVEEGLAQVDVDVVHICIGLEGRNELALKAIEAKKHVLVEKPASKSVDIAIDLLNSARENQVLMCPVHQFPFQRGFEGLKNLKPSLGELKSITYQVNTAGGESLSPQQRRTLMIDILPHAVSLLSNIDATIEFGEKHWNTLVSDDENLIVANSTEPCFKEVRICCSGRPVRNELTVIGTAGSVTLDLFHGFAFRDRGNVSRLGKILRPFRVGMSMILAAGMNLTNRIVRRQPAYPGLQELICEFYHATHSGGPSPVSEPETINAARLCQTIEGMTTGTRIERTSQECQT